MNPRTVRDDLFLEDDALSERLGYKMVPTKLRRHSFPERGSRTPPTYATMKRGEEWGSVTGVFHEWDLKGKGFSRTPKPPPPKNTFGFKNQSLGSMRCIEYYR